MECDVRIKQLVQKLRPLDQRVVDGALSQSEARQREDLEQELLRLAGDASIKWGQHAFLRFALCRKYHLRGGR